MRILLILLSLVLQWNVSGNSVNIPQENCVQKTLNAENSAADFDCPFVGKGSTRMPKQDYTTTDTVTTTQVRETTSAKTRLG
jgi:hypothetical protein